MKYAFIWKTKGGYTLEYCADAEAHNPVTVLTGCSKKEAVARAKADGAQRWNF